jgi:hypothetical protein
MFESGRGKWDVDKVARFVTHDHVDNARRFLEGQPAQEQIVYQTEDCGVSTDGERESDHGDDGEPWRFSQRPKCVFEVGDHKASTGI